LAEGEIGFASDTGEIFIGGPRVTTAQYTTPPPRARYDKNIRILTELDSVAKPNTFSNLVLQAQSGPVPVFRFLNGDNFAIVDYGISDSNSGPLVASTIYIAIGPSTVINDPFSQSEITFAVDIGIDLNPQLTAENTTGSQLILTYSKRSWQSLSSTTTTISGNLKRVTGHAGAKNISITAGTISCDLLSITGALNAEQATTQAATLSGQVLEVTGSMSLNNS
jgi:hypothetical protein